MLVTDLDQKLAQLNPTDHQIALVILADPRRVSTMSSAELARAAQVNNNTIARFAKLLGYASFAALKQKLQQDLTGAAAPMPASDLKALIKQRQQLLQQLEQELVVAQLSKLGKQLTKAQAVLVIASDDCTNLATQLQQQLTLCGLVAVTSNSLRQQRAMVASADKRTVVVFMSLSGRNIAVCELAEIAAKQQASLIAICPANSELAHIAEQVLAIPQPAIADPLRLSARSAAAVLADLLTESALPHAGEAAAHSLAAMQDCQANQYYLE